MNDQTEDEQVVGLDEGPRDATNWHAFLSARGRYLERLERLSEVTRLERALALPDAPEPGSLGESARSR